VDIPVPSSTMSCDGSSSGVNVKGKFIETFSESSRPFVMKLGTVTSSGRVGCLENWARTSSDPSGGVRGELRDEEVLRVAENSFHRDGGLESPGAAVGSGLQLERDRGYLPYTFASMVGITPFVAIVLPSNRPYGNETFR